MRISAVERIGPSYPEMSAGIPKGKHKTRQQKILRAAYLQTLKANIAAGKYPLNENLNALTEALSRKAVKGEFIGTKLDVIG